MYYLYELQVDDGEYFQTLPENSIFMFLRTGESWHPTGSDSIKAGTLFVTHTQCTKNFKISIYHLIASRRRGSLYIYLYFKNLALGTLHLELMTVRLLHFITTQIIDKNEH